MTNTRVESRDGVFLQAACISSVKRLSVDEARKSAKQ